MTAEEYANQQAIYGPMTQQFESIFNQGPSQAGFSTAETNSLNTEAIQGTAQNYKQAATALNENLASEGGGSNPLPSGAQTQLKEENATSAAGEESAEENKILQSDYQQGENNYQNAATGLLSIATGENPLGYENAESNEGNTANTEANAVASEENSWVNAAIGSAGAIGAAALNKV